MGEHVIGRVVLFRNQQLVSVLGGDGNYTRLRTYRQVERELEALKSEKEEEVRRLCEDLR